MSEIRMVRQIVLKNPRELIPYENNARINDHVVPALVEAIKRFGFNQPVVIDRSNVLVCGHTRIKAALELRMREVPCVYVEGLTQEEVDAYRLADNKIAEQALWDYDKLKVELDKIGSDIKMSVFGFENGSAPNVGKFTEPLAGNVTVSPTGMQQLNPDEDDDEDEGTIDTSSTLNSSYSQQVGKVIYEPKNTNHKPCDLFTDNSCRFKKDIDLIKDKDIRRMLELRAAIFTDFNFSKIADYYAYQASPEEKKIFERLALVVLDRDQLIENGFSDIIKEVKNGTV